MTQLIDIREDGHVHTRLCNHAVGEMEEYVEQAIRRGLTRLVFLEHLETDIRYQPNSWLSDQDFALYFREGERLKQRYHGVIDIRLGAETGFNPEAAATIRQRLAGYPFERVGVSCHFHRHGDVHLNLLTRRQPGLDLFAAIGADAVITAYFNSLIEAVATLDGDVLCHLDAALRHLPGIRFNDSHMRQIEELLDGLRAKNMALEINSSGFDHRGVPFPASWIVASALRRGIPLRAGSDAHRPFDVGRHFERLPDFLANLPA